MPTIMTAHIAKVSKKSVTVHGICVVIPIAVIIRSYSLPGDI